MKRQIEIPSLDVVGMDVAEKLCLLKTFKISIIMYRKREYLGYNMKTFSPRMKNKRQNTKDVPLTNGLKHLRKNKL